MIGTPASSWPCFFLQIALWYYQKIMSLRTKTIKSFFRPTGRLRHNITLHTLIRIPTHGCTQIQSSRQTDPPSLTATLTTVSLQRFIFPQWEQSWSGWMLMEMSRFGWGDGRQFQLYVKQSTITHAQNQTCWQQWWGLGTDITHLLHMWTHPYICIKAHTYICAVTAPLPHILYAHRRKKTLWFENYLQFKWFWLENFELTCQSVGNFFHLGNIKEIINYQFTASFT